MQLFFITEENKSDLHAIMGEEKEMRILLPRVTGQ
jgi:hypothetical protein